MCIGNITAGNTTINFQVIFWDFDQFFGKRAHNSPRAEAVKETSNVPPLRLLNSNFIVKKVTFIWEFFSAKIKDSGKWSWFGYFFRKFFWFRKNDYLGNVFRWIRFPKIFTRKIAFERRCSYHLWRKRQLLWSPYHYNDKKEK